jgi:hypothetical protein
MQIGDDWVRSSVVIIAGMNRPQWDSIDTVLLDLDGTLLDLAYDSFIWLGRVPEIFAEQNGLSLAEAQTALAPKFHHWAGQARSWYSIDFWSRAASPSTWRRCTAPRRIGSLGCRAPAGFSKLCASAAKNSCC